MGMAMGSAGLSFEDFRMLTPEELEEVFDAHRTSHEADSRERWEQVRIQTAYSIQPHVKKRITPQQLIPLKWDKPTGEVLDREEHRKRFESFMKNKKQSSDG